MNELKYLAGFHNEHISEATPGAIPKGRNSPQKPPLGLFPEQLNGTAFTMSRSQNFRSWLYRILPSVIHGEFQRINHTTWLSSTDASTPVSPMQLRWNPMAKLTQPKDFLDGIETFAVNGSVDTRSGSAIHLYRCNKSMQGRFFYNADAEMLLVPQSGNLLLKTEFGHLAVGPTEIGVIPRGIKFQVELPDGDATGYICENFGASFELPSLGPIGSNGLAAPRDFEYPQACYEHLKGDFKLITKFCGNLWGR